MKIKFITANNAEVVMDSEELAFCGVSATDMSFRGSYERRLMELIFHALEEFCGLTREGKFTLVECQPYSNGGCRLEIQFIDEPSRRLYIFENADDMLDAMNHLNYSKYFSTSQLDIQPLGHKFFMYISSTEKISKHNLAVLSEYCT